MLPHVCGQYAHFVARGAPRYVHSVFFGIKTFGRAGKRHLLGECILDNTYLPVVHAAAWRRAYKTGCNRGTWHGNVSGFCIGLVGLHAQSI